MVDTASSTMPALLHLKGPIMTGIALLGTALPCALIPPISLNSLQVVSGLWAARDTASMSLMLNSYTLQCPSHHA